MSGNCIKFRLAAYTDAAGKYNEDAPKKGNEDDLFVDADLENKIQGGFMADEIVPLSNAGCLMVVADGMGGMNAGEVASAIAIDTVKTAFKHDCLTADILASVQSRTKYLEKVIVDADAAIKSKSRGDKDCEGMGSTIILAWLCDNNVIVSWCGDSRAYLFRESDGLRQISKDHSYVQGLVDEEKITIEEAFNHPYNNIITRSLGDPEKKARPESVSVPIIKGDIIMLCSDGLSGVLRDRKSYDRDGNLLPGNNLEDLIRENHSTLTGCREALWVAAAESGWYDNVTAILCEIVEAPELVNVKTAEPACDTSVSRSFINLRIHKKSLKRVLLAILIIGICCAGLYWAKQFVSSRTAGSAETLDVIVPNEPETNIEEPSTESLILSTEEKTVEEAKDQAHGESDAANKAKPTVTHENSVQGPKDKPADAPERKVGAEDSGNGQSLTEVTDTPDTTE